MFKEKVDLQKNYTDVGVERTAVDDGLRAYLVSVYNHMAGALAVTAAVAFLVANTSLITMMFNPQTGGMSVLGWLFLLSPLIVIFGFNWVLTSGTLAQVRGVQQSEVQVGPHTLQISRPRRKAFLAALADYIGGEGV